MSNFATITLINLQRQVNQLRVLVDC